MAAKVRWRDVEEFSVVEAFGNRYAFCYRQGTLFPLPFDRGMLAYALLLEDGELRDRQRIVRGGLEDLTFVMER